MLSKRIAAFVIAALAVLGLSGAGALAASASPPAACPTTYLWANPVLHPSPLFCYANLVPGTTWTRPE